MHEGVEGLTRDKTRPSRIPPLPAETVDRVVALTNQAPPHRGDPLDRAGDGQDGGDQPLLGAAHLDGPRAAAASGALVQALQRPQIRREAQGRRRPLHRSAGPCRGAQPRREKPNPGARPYPARAADEEGTLRHDDPRLQAQRHHHPVRRPRYPRRQGHRALHAAPPASGIHPLSQCRRTRSAGRQDGPRGARQLCHPQAPQEPALAKAVRSWLHAIRASPSTSRRHRVPGPTPSKVGLPSSPGNASSAASSPRSSSFTLPSTASSPRPTTSPSRSSGPNPPTPSSPLSTAGDKR